MNKQWKKVVPILLGSSFWVPTCVKAIELTDQTYTSYIGDIQVGNYTVSQDVIRDASGYTGYYSGHKALVNTINGAANIAIAEGKTLTLKGYSANDTQNGSTLYAYQRGAYPGNTISFTGGNIIVSNEVGYTAAIRPISVISTSTGGKIEFKSAGDNKINLHVLIPNVPGFTNTSHTASKTAIDLNRGELTFDGGHFSIFIEDTPIREYRTYQTGISLHNSNIDVKADDVLIDTQYGEAIYLNDSQAKFEADNIFLKANSGIISRYNSNTNTIEFTGNTRIEAIVQEMSEENAGNYYLGLFNGGRAIDVSSTNITFNSSNPVVVIGENLSPRGTMFDPNYPGIPEEELRDPYWLRTVSITDGSKLTTNADFYLSSNGGYYNTGLYIWDSQSEFNGKTTLVMQNGVDTTRGIYMYGGANGTTQSTFRDDLSILLAGTQADYISGIEVWEGSKVDIHKGLTLNDNDNIYWSLYAADPNSSINVNTSGAGNVQVVGDIAARDEGVINMTLNNAHSYLTAASYTSPRNSTSKGIINLNIAKQAVWNMTGASSVSTLTMNNGHVNFLAPQNNSDFKTLTIHGDYIGSGTLTMNTALLVLLV